jgi:general secretion pathway protein M
MIERLIGQFRQLQERERRMVTIGGAVALLLLVFVIVMPLERSVGASAQRLERKRDDLAWLRSVAPQLRGLTAASAPPPLRESLVVLVDRTARESSLAKSLVGSQPSGDGGLNVRLDQVPFDGLVAWLAQLRDHYGIRVDSATIDAANTPGTVNATLVLHTR